MTLIIFLIKIKNISIKFISTDEHSRKANLELDTFTYHTMKVYIKKKYIKFGYNPKINRIQKNTHVRMNERCSFNNFSSLNNMTQVYNTIK